MNRLWSVLVVLCCLFRPAHVQGAPSAYYHPLTGNVKFFNDTSTTIIAYFYSQTGALNDASSVRIIPDVFRDVSEMPMAYAYVSLPPGLHDTGNTVMIGTPVADLGFQWRMGTRPVEDGPVIEIAEPSSSALASLVLPALAVARRRITSKRAGSLPIMGRWKGALPSSSSRIPRAHALAFGVILDSSLRSE